MAHFITHLYNDEGIRWCFPLYLKYLYSRKSSIIFLAHHHTMSWRCVKKMTAARYYWQWPNFRNSQGAPHWQNGSEGRGKEAILEEEGRRNLKVSIFWQSCTLIPPNYVKVFKCTIQCHSYVTFFRTVNISELCKHLWKILNYMIWHSFHEFSCNSIKIVTLFVSITNLCKKIHKKFQIMLHGAHYVAFSSICRKTETLRMSVDTVATAFCSNHDCRTFYVVGSPGHNQWLVSHQMR